MAAANITRRIMVAKKKASTTGRSSQRSEAGKTIDTKAGQLRLMLRRPEGATITEIALSLRWQPHTVRAALSRLRKAGNLATTVTEEREGVRTYRVVE
jgi:predicted ArsR family transcriptional regulator